MLVRMCRPLVLAAGVNRVAVSVYTEVTSPCPLVLAAWALYVFGAVDIHTHEMYTYRYSNYVLLWFGFLLIEC